MVKSKYRDDGNGPVWMGTPEEEQVYLNDATRLREEAKQARQAAVAAITVTVNGKVFDGDELSQTRMARAIIGMQAASVETIQWTLADNTITSATIEELTTALILAGQKQAELWQI